MHESIRNQSQCITPVEPEMFDLKKIVIPKIMNEWEDIADALRCDLATIQAIKVREHQDPKKCCREFFKDWLMTNNGAKAGPKVWSTLLDALKEVEISADITEDIVAKVKQLNGGHEGYAPQGMHVYVSACHFNLYYSTFAFT